MILLKRSYIVKANWFKIFAFKHYALLLVSRSLFRMSVHAF